MNYSERILKKINAAYPGADIYLKDQSELHAGHAGAKPGGETHFRLEVTSHAFEGMPRLERQRQVHALLEDELKEQVHALSLSLRTPSESQKHD